MPIIRDIVYGAASRGASLTQLCDKLGIDVADLDDSEKRVDFDTSARAWELAVKMTGDRLLGLHIGQSTNPSIMGLVGYLMQHSKTLLDAFRQVCKYSSVATNMFVYRIIERKDEVVLEYTPVAAWKQLYPGGARQAVDQAKAGTLNVFYLLSGKRVTPGRTTPNQLIFNREQLLVKVERSDRSLYKVFEELVKKRAKAKTFGEEVKRLILNDFRGIVPPIEVVAVRLNVTVRTLQRRLSAEKTSFRRISLQIVREVGLRLLKTGSKRAQIASILGYSSARSFRRAIGTSR